MKAPLKSLSAGLVLCLVAGCAPSPVVLSAPDPAPVGTYVPPSTAEKIVAGARKQIGTAYTPGYFKIAYPNGDLPSDQGVCTDVVIRALRHAGYDLQKLIHEDMRSSTYPRREGRGRDSNIDHRRVPNQMHFFARFGKKLPIAVDDRSLKAWQPGDFIYWKLDSGLDHAGVVSDVKNIHGVPLVIHNLGRCAEEDVLTSWKITGHYRFPKR
jgi:uncharacterized protein